MMKTSPRRWVAIALSCTAIALASATTGWHLYQEHRLAAQADELLRQVAGTSGTAELMRFRNLRLIAFEGAISNRLEALLDGSRPLTEALQRPLDVIAYDLRRVTLCGEIDRRDARGRFTGYAPFMSVQATGAAGGRSVVFDELGERGQGLAAGFCEDAGALDVVWTDGYQQLPAP